MACCNASGHEQRSIDWMSAHRSWRPLIARGEARMRITQSGRGSQRHGARLDRSYSSRVNGLMSEPSNVAR